MRFSTVVKKLEFFRFGQDFEVYAENVELLHAEHAQKNVLAHA